MSFLKKIFEKHKDSKYGKGHRLGDAQPSPESPVHGTKKNEEPVSLGSNNEAAQKAGEAALMRLQSKTAPRPSNSKTSMRSEVSDENKEMKKALELKEHYFGKPV